METYATVAIEVAPKREKLAKAMKGLAKSEAQLAEAKEKLAEVVAHKWQNYNVAMMKVSERKIDFVMKLKH